uniref:Uncharacterized protein n=1 Tax=Nelumbo nucifera TaxID=4432 RepID=A0A822XFI3_NELNU|nr:TPA_asm: hypothetical protein HUJ06_019232 [Nelumbo nucifera]
MMGRKPWTSQKPDFNYSGSLVSTKHNACGKFQE